MERTATIGSALAVGIVGLLGLPAYRSLVQRLGTKTDYEHLDQPYEDEDGEATEETQRQFHTRMPRRISLLAILLGSIAAVVLAVLGTINMLASETAAVPSWLRATGWLVLMVHALAVFVEPAARRRFRLGIAASAASLLVVLSVALAAIAQPERDLRDTEVLLLLVQMALGCLALLAFVSIPRRPMLYSDGRPVDGERTTSYLGRLSFSWSTFLIARAEQKRTLDYSDLPQLPRSKRAADLAAWFESSRQYSRLWRTLFVTFRWAIAKQWYLVSVKSVIMFVPQYAMLQILKILEAPDRSHEVGVWVWVCVLGAVLILLSFLENWLFWIVWTELGIPIRNTLSALVFQKSMRRKDVKGVGKKNDEPAPASNPESALIANLDSPPAGESTALPAGNVGADKDAADPSDEEIDQKTRQTTINLVGVDSNRIGQFVTYAYFYPGTITQITVSVVFLGQIIGWKPLLAGLACFATTIPMNILVSKKYATLQARLMELRDKKLAVTNEALQGIRQIKFSALEQQWQEKIGVYRKQEIDTQWWIFIYEVFLISCYIWSPIFLSAGSLATYALLYGDLAPSVAFTTIAILTALEAALGVLPELTTDAIDAWVSVNRIDEYLNAPEVVDCIDPAEQIHFDNASIAWPADDQAYDPDRFVLRNLNFTLPAKELSVITGKTGSGKSLLLASLLSEIDKLEGSIYAPRPPPPAERFDAKATKGNWILDSAIAFVAQVPWIENATLRDNILFGLPLDQGRYQKTLQACALSKDLEMLDDGDMTEIGHNGVNLSGGQRWRVSFARALYSRAGILVLDDVFSAVDAHVGRQLFEEALTGELALGRTRILVTHHFSLVLPKTRYVVHLADGTVQYAGSVENLRRDGRLDAILEDDEPTATSSDEGTGEGEDEASGEENGVDLTKVMSRRSQRSAVIDDGGKPGKPHDTPKKFIEDEHRETGAIKATVYRHYIRSSGGLWIWTAIALVYAVNEIVEVTRNWWVSLWTDSYKSVSSVGTASPLSGSWFHPASNLQQPVHLWQNQTAAFLQDDMTKDTLYYLKVYLLLSLASCVFGSLKYFNAFMASIKASRVLFAQLSYTVLRTPLRWLDTVPVGRILNRFTADFNTIDSSLASHMGFAVYKVGETVGITVVSFITSPYMIPLAVLLMLIAGYVARRFLTAARATKRLENNAKSPIFELFGSSLIGLATVRGYSKGSEYIDRMHKRIDEHGRSFWNLWLMNRWMGFRLSVIGAIFTFCVAFVIAASDVPAPLAGFALAFALNYSDAIIWLLRAYAGLELDMTSAERVMEFSRLEIENQGGKEAPAAWPAKGELTVEGLVCGYAPDLPPVLKGLSFTAASGQRVGVVGRTGAGKSSLTLALFRFLEPREGRVLIDGIDIATLTLHSLRSRLAIIPQDPVLFSGTVRSNLDPFEQHPDSALRDALERVHLVSPTSTPRPASSHLDENTNIFRSLNSRISEGGLNLSQGQRQLLCLARAIVARPRLMVLDEATSAVDKETDALIQRSIRAEFAGSTLIVIAHRLSTIADFDRILVLGDGRVLEFGTPKELIGLNDGVFRGMVESSGEREDLERIIASSG